MNIFTRKNDFLLATPMYIVLISGLLKVYLISVPDGRFVADASLSHR